MTRITVAFLLVLLFSVPLFAQSVDTAWVRRYDGPGNLYDFAYAIAVDALGNAYVTGYSFGNGTGDDIATIKYYPNGDTAWIRRYNGPSNSSDEAHAIAVDSSGNVYVTGLSYASGEDCDYLTIKYDPAGDTVWVRRYAGPGNGLDEAHALAVDDLGNVYVTGGSSADGKSTDFATVKYNSNGDTVWVRRYRGTAGYFDYGRAIAVDRSGNVYVAGPSDDSFSSTDYATIKYLPNGDTAWVRRYNGPGNLFDEVHALAVDSSGNVYVTGGSDGVGTPDDYATIKYFPNGDTAWVRRYDGPENSDDFATALAVDGSGNVYVTGGSSGHGTFYDYATVKYLPDGDTAWVRRYNGPGNLYDEAYALAVDRSGSVYVTGWSDSVKSSSDYATIKYLADGNAAWVRRYNGPGDSSDYVEAIAVDTAGNVYVTGGSDGSLKLDDYATIKYVQFLRADANRDTKVTIADIVYLVSYLFKFGPAPNPVQAGDANCDSKVTIADIVYLVSYLFKFGPAPCI